MRLLTGFLTAMLDLTIYNYNSVTGTLKPFCLFYPTKCNDKENNPWFRIATLMWLFLTLELQINRAVVSLSEASTTFLSLWKWLHLWCNFFSFFEIIERHFSQNAFLLPPIITSFFAIRHSLISKRHWNGRGFQIEILIWNHQ